MLTPQFARGARDRFAWVGSAHTVMNAMRNPRGTKSRGRLSMLLAGVVAVSLPLTLVVWGSTTSAEAKTLSIAGDTTGNYCDVGQTAAECGLRVDKVGSYWDEVSVSGTSLSAIGLAYDQSTGLWSGTISPSAVGQTLSGVVRYNDGHGWKTRYPFSFKVGEPQTLEWSPASVIYSYPYTPPSATVTSPATGTGAITYRKWAYHSDVSDCSVDAATGKITYWSRAGECPIIARAAAVGRLSATEVSRTIIIAGASSATSVSPSSGSAAGGNTVTITGNNFYGVSSVTFDGVAATSFTVNAATQITAVVPQAVRTGSISVIVSNGAGSSGSTSYTYNQGAQTVTWSPATALKYGQSPVTPTPATALGGAITYTNLTANYAGVAYPKSDCSVDSLTGRIGYSKLGICVVEANAAATAIYLAGSATQNFVIGKGDQVISWAPRAPFRPGYSPAYLAAAAALGGATLSYSKVSTTMTSCTIDSTTRALSYSGTGDCIIRVSTPEVDYYVAGSKDFTFTSREVQAITVSAPSSVPAGSTTRLTASGAVGTGAQSFAVTSGAASCSISGDILSAVGVGTCQVVATVAEDSTYASATSAPLTVTVTRSPQTIALSGSTPASVVAGTSTPLTATGYSGTGARTFSIVSGSTYCAISGGNLIALAAGTCTVGVAIAEDSVYAHATSTPVAVDVTRAPRSLSMSAPSLMSATQSASLSVTGAVGTSPVVYSIVTGASSCQLTGQVVTATAVGSCTLQASQVDDTFFAAAASATVTVTVSRQTQVVTWSPVAAITMPQSPVGLTAAAPLGSLTVAYTVIAPTTTGCVVNSSTGQLYYVAPGTCTVRASTLETDVYEAGSTDVTFTISKAASGIAWSAGSSTMLATESPVLLPTATVNGGGPISYVASSVGSTGCAITGTRTLEFTSEGTCQVTASVAGDDTYLPGSTSRTFSINRDAQPLAWSPSVTSATMADDTMAFDVASTPVGGGAITYAATAGTAGCSVPDPTRPVLHFTSVGTCTVSSTAALTSIYEASTITRTFSIALATPVMSWTPVTAIELLDSPHLPGVLPSTTSDDTVTYAVVGGTSDCAVNSLTGVLTFTTLGTCQVTGSTSVTSRYAAGSMAATFVIGRAVRPITLVAAPASITVGETSRLSTTGSPSTGAVSYSITAGAGCVLSGTDLTASTPVTCAVRVDVAQDDTYAAAAANVIVSVIAAPNPPRPPGPPVPPPDPGDPGGPLPRALDPILEAAQTPPGDVLVSVGGEEVSVRVVPHADRRGIEISSDNWAVDVVSVAPDGEPVALEPDGTLAVTTGGVIDVTGRGFESIAQVRTYLLSGPVTLGSLMTDSVGSFEGSLPVSVTMAPGADALQINGFTPNREVRSITLGVNVGQPAVGKVLRTKLTFAKDSARLTKISHRKLRSLMKMVSTVDHVYTTITGKYFPPRGVHGRVLAQARCAQVRSYLKEMGLDDSDRVFVKPARGKDETRGRRVVVRTYYLRAP